MFRSVGLEQPYLNAVPARRSPDLLLSAFRALGFENGGALFMGTKTEKWMLF